MNIQKQLNKIKQDIKKIEAQLQKPTTHTRTIIWGEVSEEEMTWHEAKKWCEERGGRLPTLIELLLACEDKVDDFSSCYCYWSATENAAGESWRVSLSYGDVAGHDKDASNYVRCVYDKKIIKHKNL